MMIVILYLLPKQQNIYIFVVIPIQVCGTHLLLAYYVTGSKFAVDINSKGSLAGSYTTMKKWISDHSKEPMNYSWESDVVTFFDNNQVYNFNYYV